MWQEERDSRVWSQQLWSHETSFSQVSKTLSQLYVYIYTIKKGCNVHDTSCIIGRVPLEHKESLWWGDTIWGGYFTLRQHFSSNGSKTQYMCNYKRDFPLLSLRPLLGPSSSTIASAAFSSSAVPQRVPSSKYHELICNPGISHLILFTIGPRAKRD